MRGSRRIERLNGLLQEEISRVIRTEIKDPRVGLITVTGVQTTTDLMYAVVYVRTLGDQTPVEEAIEGLDSAEGYIRRLLGRELHIRRIPELRFVADRTIEHAQRIEALLEEARAEDGSEPAAD